MGKQLICGAVGAVVLASAWAAPAWAWDGKIDTPTFYRAGPGRNYVVLDEMDRGQSVDVIGCTGDWCQVVFEQTTGWVEKAAVVVPGDIPAQPPVPGPQGCVESRVTGSGYTGGLMYRFCPAPARPAVPDPYGQSAPAPLPARAP